MLKMHDLAGVIVCLVMLISQSKADENITRDLGIETLVPANFTINGSGAYFDRLFKVTNKDYITGRQDSIIAFIEFNISFETQSSKLVLAESSFTLQGINSFKTAGTGAYNFTLVGSYALCGRIVNSTPKDPNTENNNICSGITAYSYLHGNTTDDHGINSSNTSLESNVSMNISDGNLTTNFTTPNVTLNLSFNITDPLGNSSNSYSNGSNSSFACNITFGIRPISDIFEDEPIVFYNEVLPRKSNFTVEYWIEDLFGRTVKAPVRTANLNAKQYTPRTKETDAVFIIRSILFGACAQELSSHKLVVYKNSQPEIEICKPNSSAQQSKVENSSQLCKVNAKSDPSLIRSFYRLANKPSNETTLYSSIYADNVSTVQLYKMELLHNFTPNESRTYGFGVPLGAGLNNFILMAGQEALLMDFKLLKVHNNITSTKPSPQIQSNISGSIINGSSNLSISVSSMARRAIDPKEADLSHTANTTSKSNLVSGKVIYESSGDKAVSAVPYLFAAAFFLMCYIAWKKL